MKAHKAPMPNMWQDRDTLAKQQWRAQAVWDVMDEPRRAAAYLAVGEKLIELLETLREWLPRGINLKDEQCLEVTFSVILPKLTDSAVSERVEMVRARAEAVTELTKFAQQFEPEGQE